MIRKVALIVFYDEQKNILLQRKKPGSEKKYKGIEWRPHHILLQIWSFFGGEVEKGETPEQALVREIKEELDWDLKEYEFVGKFKHRFNEKRSTIKFVFISPIRHKFSKFKQYEGDKMQFFSLEEAEKLHMIPGDELIIQKLRKFLQKQL